VHDNLLVVDLTKRLQVFSPEGKHLCTAVSLHALDRLMIRFSCGFFIMNISANVLSNA
jgi:hypothetical protein